ncbi:MAG: hypothetical protein JWO13_3088 [Acidobacteriales bacterium]|nr:hypothetical protein [Terriglobales bacterium]
MYIASELAACVLLALAVGIVLLTIFGIGYVVKSGFMLCAKAVRLIHSRINIPNGSTTVQQSGFAANASI